MSAPTIPAKKSIQPIDRLALVIMVVLSLLIGIVLLTGDTTRPRVRDFTWQDKYVSAEDTAFILTFSRPMDHASVEANLKITPVLPEGEVSASDVPPIEGKISWAGRKMAYTLLSPIPYGNDYQVQLQGAKEKIPGVENEQSGTVMEPFQANFHSRDRAFAYIGVEGEEQGRLILYNLTRQQKTVLTPADLVVLDFKPYPESDRILFAANDRQNQAKGLLTAQLYTVTTGLSFPSPDQRSPSQPAVGKLDLVLDSQNYQNLQFDLSKDGQTIVVQRVNRDDPADFGLWMIPADGEPQPLENQPGGEFLIAPDSASLAVAQGQGVAILPLNADAEPLDFLPKFGQVLSFASDGSAATMVKFNTDYTRSLFLVNNQGTEQELLRTTGSIVSCEFAPNQDTLFCLLTQLIQGEEYREEPFIAAVNLNADPDSEESPVQPLVVLPEQRDIQLSLSPDGLALLFDQVATRPASPIDSLRNDEGQAIATGRLWLLPLDESINLETVQLQPEPLLPGFLPHWLP